MWSGGVWAIGWHPMTSARRHWSRGASAITLISCGDSVNWKSFTTILISYAALATHDATRDMCAYVTQTISDLISDNSESHKLHKMPRY